jgi:hypothetical protein
MTLGWAHLGLAASLLLAAPVSSSGIRASSPTGTAASAGTGATAQPPAPGFEVPMLGPPACPWKSQSGQRLLDRHLEGSLSFVQATVEDIVRELMEKHHVPLSFIAADAAPRLTFTIREGTLRELLERIVTEAPVYRYRFVGARLVLYPADPLWESRLDDLRLAPGPRRWVGEALVVELRRRVPALAVLNPPWTIGTMDSFVYRDQVSVAGPASLVELFTQVLGNRASASFMVSKRGGQITTFWLESTPLIRSLELTAPTTTLRRPGETVQLRLVGTLYDGTRQALTAAACGAEYATHPPQVLKVSPEGLVTAIGTGEAEVTAFSEDVGATLELRVEPGDPRRLERHPDHGLLSRTGFRAASAPSLDRPAGTGRGTP